MVISMTGYGRGTIETEQFTVIVEVKSVNHRFLEFSIRMPKTLLVMEDKIKKKISEEISRGRVEVYVTIEGAGQYEKKVVVDWPLLEEYMHSLKLIGEKYQLQDEISLKDILQCNDIITIEEKPTENDELAEALLNCLEIAIQQLKEMRIMEGEQLEKDLQEQLNVLKNKVEDMKEYAPLIVQQYANKLKKRMEELARGEIDESRLVNEVAIFADKIDINEEITRLLSHIEQFLQALQLNVPIGRKLDFLVQEMNREVNTIGSKGNDSQIAREVVEMKSILEKLKEQVQNIE